MNFLSRIWHALTSANLQPDYVCPEGGLETAHVDPPKREQLRSHLRTSKTSNGLAPSGFGVGSPATEGAGPLEQAEELTLEDIENRLLALRRTVKELRLAYNKTLDGAELMGLVQVHLQGVRVPNAELVLTLRKTASAMFQGIEVLETVIAGGEDESNEKRGQA